jgi:hypothetical protein
VAAHQWFPSGNLESEPRRPGNPVYGHTA